MKLRFSTVGALLLVGVLMISSFVGSSPQTCWTSPGIAWAVPDETSQQKKLPPLIVDTDSPLMLEEAGKKADPDKEIAPSVLENTACYVCHENYRTEELVAQHADNDVGCVDCHGKSYAHRNDENNTTPPDVMFPRNRIEEGCASCHDSHDVSAAEVVARLRERVPHMSQSQDLACTDCHGYHRLDHRTVVWNRETRELLTGSKQSTQDKRGPSWNSLKSLAGTWVQAGKDGKPSDKVVSTYRVTAAGSAIVEVLFPGSEQEMVTVYHQDGDDLLLTHYLRRQESAAHEMQRGCRTEPAAVRVCRRHEYAVDERSAHALRDDQDRGS